MTATETLALLKKMFSMTATQEEEVYEMLIQLDFDSYEAGKTYVFENYYVRH